ncbi:MAG TPA: hypothetical protein VM099_08740 [Gemmatimonadaceae bacterium]|nr:hypothetical protein [Gemmatimonadaceae bacterium]
MSGILYCDPFRKREDTRLADSATCRVGSACLRGIFRQELAVDTGKEPELRPM